MDREAQLTAYVDGELDPAARAAFERALEADPELRLAAERQQRLRARLSAAYDPVLREPPPLRLALAAQAANERGGGWRAPQWAAMAACLALGVLAGRALLPTPGPLAARDGALVLHGRLASALDEKLAAEAGPTKIGVTFKSTDGRWCRTFQSAPDRLAGLACRDRGGWTALALAAWSPPQPGAYRMAGSETPAAVLAAVDGLIAGSPLDAAGERAARDRGWKP